MRSMRFVCIKEATQYHHPEAAVMPCGVCAHGTLVVCVFQESLSRSDLAHVDVVHSARRR